MRCKCCNHALTDKEVVWNDDLDDFELCTTCLDIALDAAYSGGFNEYDEFIPIFDFGGIGGDDVEFVSFVEPQEYEE